jgi:hypothetical protein
VNTTINVLEDIEDESLSFYEELTCLLEAIDNWESEIVTLENYLSSVESFLGNSLSVNRLEISKILEQKNPRETAWKMESISILLELLDNDDDLLVDVLNNLFARVIDYLSNNRM